MPAPRRHPRYWLHRILNSIANLPIPAALRGVAVWVFGVLSFCVTILLALLEFADPNEQDLNQLWKWVLAAVHRNRFAIAITLIIAEIVCILFIAVLKFLTKSFSVAKVEEALNSAVEQHFPKQNRAKYVYRATLFKIRGFRATGFWLGVVARSGVLFPRSRSVLSIHEYKSARNTGFAGQCWWEGEQTVYNKKPLVSVVSDQSEQNKRSYMTEGLITEEEYRAMEVHSVAFMATGIEIAGRLWGILVLDSTDPHALLCRNVSESTRRRIEKRQTEHLDRTAHTLSLLLS